MSNPIAERKRKRLEAKPPKYNESCEGCKERAFDIMKAMDAIDENIDTVEEIYDLMDAANDNAAKIGEAIEALRKEVDTQRKTVNEQNEVIKEHAEFIGFLKRIRKYIAMFFAAATAVFGILGALPSRFWEWLLTKVLGGN